MNAYPEASDTPAPATLRDEHRRAGKHRCDACRTQRAESCGVVDESFGPARALRAVWTSPWTTRARRPPPCPHCRASRPQAPQDDQQREISRNRTGQPLCYKTGQFYLLPTPLKGTLMYDSSLETVACGAKTVPHTRQETGEPA